MGYLKKWRAAVSIGWLANWKLVRNLSRPKRRHYPGIFLGKTSGITVVMRVESRTANFPIQARSSIAWDSLLNPHTTVDLFLDVTPYSFVHRYQHRRRTWAAVQVHNVTVPQSAPENRKPHMLIYETGSVSVTYNCGAFAQPLWQWKRNKPFCVFFTHYLINDTIYGVKITENKPCVLILSTTAFQKFYHSK
jgi:hypothetical protein